MGQIPKDGATRMKFLVLTVIGDDRPGLVGELSAAISAHHGNWMESSLSRLAGKFAGIVKVGISPEHEEALRKALAHIRSLTVSALPTEEPVRAPGRKLRLSLVGHDRIGIVKEITQVLAQHAVNVESLETHTSSAPMSAATLFHAKAELLASANLDPKNIQADLERISNDLMVDFQLEEAEPAT